MTRDVALTPANEKELEPVKPIATTDTQTEFVKILPQRSGAHDGAHEHSLDDDDEIKPTEPDLVNSAPPSPKGERETTKERHARDKANCPICIRKRAERARRKAERL